MKRKKKKYLKRNKRRRGRTRRNKQRRNIKQWLGAIEMALYRELRLEVPDELNGFVRTMMREGGFWRRIISPRPISVPIR